MAIADSVGQGHAAGATRRSLLAEVRRRTEQLTRRAERSGIFSRMTPARLAQVELERHLQQGTDAEAASQCLILLACAVHGGVAIGLDVFEQCHDLAARSHDPALRALFFTCARRVVLGGPRLS
jgi:hypothetical protein